MNSSDSSCKCFPSEIRYHVIFNHLHHRCCCKESQISNFLKDDKGNKLKLSIFVTENHNTKQFLCKIKQKQEFQKNTI